MNNQPEYCIVQFIRAIGPDGASPEAEPQPFVGLASARRAVRRTMRKMLAEHPDRNWNGWAWHAELRVHKGPLPDPGECMRSYTLFSANLAADGITHVETTLQPERYLVFGNLLIWFTDHGPNALHEALSGIVLESWGIAFALHRGMVASWLDLRCGELRHYDLQLRAVAV